MYTTALTRGNLVACSESDVKSKEKTQGKDPGKAVITLVLNLAGMGEYIGGEFLTPHPTATIYIGDHEK